MTKVSTNFDLEDEVEFSLEGERHGIDNVVPVSLLPNVQLAAMGMEHVRTLLGNLPIRVTSWYRCPEVNTLVKGSATSAHMEGFAVDFTCSLFGSPLDIVKHLANVTGFKFDQLIEEGRWVHISFAPTLRGQVLRAVFSQYGRTTYPHLGVEKA